METQAKSDPSYQIKQGVLFYQGDTYEHLECVEDVCGNTKHPGVCADLWYSQETGECLLTLGGDWEHYMAGDWEVPDITDDPSLIKAFLNTTFNGPRDEVFLRLMEISDEF